MPGFCYKDKGIPCLIFIIALLLPGVSIAFDTLLDLSFLEYHTHHFWNKQGQRKNSRTHFRKNEGQIYFEVIPVPGCVFSTLGTFAAIHDRLNGNAYGFGDIELNWTFQPLPNCAETFWLNVTTIIPAGDEKDSLRYGRWAIEGDLFYSNAKLVYDVPCWYYVGIGYRAYQGFPSDQVRAIINGTAALSSRLFLYGIGNVEWGIFNGRRKEHFNQILYNPNYRLVKIQTGILGYITDWLYVDAGYYRHVWGENIGTGGGFIGGFGLRF